MIRTHCDICKKEIKSKNQGNLTFCLIETNSREDDGTWQSIGGSSELDLCLKCYRKTKKNIEKK